MKSEWCYFKSYFSKEYCNLLLERTQDTNFCAATIGVNSDIVDVDIRNVQCLNLDKNIFQDFHEELWKLHISANDQWFNFIVDDMECVQLLKYDSKLGGKYEKHQDTIWNNHGEKHRKITAVVQLSDSNAYQGGDLTLFDCMDYPNSEDIRQQGTVIFFPSFIFHRVHQVTSGIRYSAVSWYLGPKFR